ncbi:hypothetical protein CBR_g45524 [Chara braunii]|uniref:Integrase catalytic domain-containing protein n=1 Tax=Chara braunii TaxID=69332 RepID=A0A388LYU0_CHABU|nr:hypothetical protein CBR_g45524 [Chara braunii]|eukprot:GBG87466.1 hypothetical protein CBR_g45524 [Chara braunii]
MKTGLESKNGMARWFSFPTYFSGPEMPIDVKEGVSVVLLEEGTWTDLKPAYQTVMLDEKDTFLWIETIWTKVSLTRLSPSLMDFEFWGTVEARGWVYLSQEMENAVVIGLVLGTVPYQLFRQAEREVVWAACQRAEMKMDKVEVQVELGDRENVRRPLRTMRERVLGWFDPEATPKAGEKHRDTKEGEGTSEVGETRSSEGGLKRIVATLTRALNKNQGYLADAKKKLTFDGTNVTEFLIDYENLATLLKWTEEEKIDHLGQHVSLSLGRDIMTTVTSSGSWKETRNEMMRKYLKAEKMATEAELAAVQRKNYTTYNEFLRAFTLVALRIPGVTDRIMSKYFLRHLSEFDKDKILSAYQQTSKFEYTRDVDFNKVTDLAEKTVVTETLALLKEGEVIDLTGKTEDKVKKGIESLHERVHGVDNKIERVENALLVMQAQVSRPALPPQEAVVPAAVANRGYGRRDPVNEQCEYCTMVGHFASPRLLKGLRQLLTRRRVEVEESPEPQEQETEEAETPQGVSNLQRIPGDLEDLEKAFADIRLSLPDREGGEVTRAPPGTKLSFHALPVGKLKVHIGTHHTDALVDCGAKITLIRRDFATITGCTVNKEVTGSIRGAGGEILFEGYVTKCAVRAGIKESIWSFKRMIVMEEMGHDIILGRPWCANVEMIGMHLHDGTYMVDIEDPVTDRGELLRLLGTGGDPAKGKLATWSPTFKESARKRAFARMKGMTGMVATYCQTCLICQERSSACVFELLRPIRVLGPGHLVHLDLAVMPVSTDGYRYILDARDNLSGYVEAVTLKRKTRKGVADWIEDFYLRHPFVRRFIADNGTEFVNQKVLGRLKALCVPIKIIEPYHPEANAPVERGHRTLKNTIAKLAVDDLGNWPRYLKQAVFSENMTPKRMTGCIPAEFCYEREIDLPVEALVPTWNRLDDNPHMSTEELTAARCQQVARNEEALEDVVKNVMDSRMRDKARWDQVKKIQMEPLQVGEKVLVRNSAFENTWSGQLGRRFKGPYKIAKRVGLNMFELEDLDGTGMKGSFLGQRLVMFFSRDPVERWLQAV